MSRTLQDLRSAARGLGRQPGLFAAAALTLALGIGGNSAIFSVVDALLLRPPPFRDPGRLVVVWGSNPGLARSAGLADQLPVSYGDFYDWQRQARSFERLALMQPDAMTLTGRGDARQLAVVRVSGDFDELLGTPPALGRALLPADDAAGAGDRPGVALLSDDGWRRWFGADPRIVGAKVLLNGEPLTVVGVMPPRFAFPRGSEMPSYYGFAPAPDAWVPLARPADQRQGRSDRNAVAIGRLRRGVGIAAAQAEMAEVCRRLAQVYATDKGWSARLAPLAEQLVGELRPGLLLLWGAVGCVLLIACANVANLLLVRAASRQREIAVRTALGAGRGRLVAQLLAESGLLSLLGGLLGALLAAAGLRAFAAFVPAAAGGGPALSGRVLAFTAALCIATTLLAGLVPALQMTRPELAQLLRGGVRSGTAAGSRRVRNLLVVAELTLAVVLLIGAGLLLRSFARLLSVDPGFRAAGALSFEIDLPEVRLHQPAQVALYFQRVADRLRALPGVVAAGGISELPLAGVEAKGGVYIEGRPVPVKPEEVMIAHSPEIVPGYFQAMGIPLLRGRLLDAGDTAEKPRVAVIDEAMARAFWPGQDPLGARIRRASYRKRGDDPANPWYTVVGVVGTVRQSSLDAAPYPEMYRTAAQTLPALARSYMVFVVRGSGPATARAGASLAGAARAAVSQVDRDQPIVKLRTLEQVADDSVARRRFSLLLLGLFAVLALTLSAVGIYGVTSYSVAQRTRELGLRMALGARPGAVVGLVLGEAGWLAALGVALGVGGGLALTRLLSSMLYGVAATDPPTFAAVALGLPLIALGAAYLPARRATEVDPIAALRAE